MDSYHPKDNLSVTPSTVAPSSELSKSGDITPSLSGTKQLSRATAMWTGIRQSISTSHSPALKEDMWGGTCSSKRLYEMPVTAMSASWLLVGFCVPVSNAAISDEKCRWNTDASNSETKVIARGALLEHLYIWRETAGTTGKRAHTS